MSYIRQVIDYLKDTFVRDGKGDHEMIWYSPITKRSIIDHKSHTECAAENK